LEEKEEYIVNITPEAESFYYKLLENLYSTHTEISASKKGDEILDLAHSLKYQPKSGRIEEQLKYLDKQHRFLVYNLTPRKTIKIIYFIDEAEKIVFVTDFFPCLMNPDSMMQFRGE